MTRDTLLPPAVLFDWDNTLIDTLPLIRDANNVIRRHFGLSEWSIAETHASTQLSGREGLQVHYGERWQEAESLFYAYIAANHLQSLSLTDGARALVDWLYGQGVPMGIVSNKRGAILRAEVVHLGWDHLFGCVIGPDDVGGAGKPRPDGIYAVLDAIGIKGLSRQLVWYVGDTANDMRTARAAQTVPVFIANKNAADEPGEMPDAPLFHFADCCGCLDYLSRLVNSTEK